MPEDAKMAEVDQQLEEEVAGMEEKVIRLSDRVNRAEVFGSYW